MGLYEEWVFNPLMDWMLAKHERLVKVRSSLLAGLPSGPLHGGSQHGGEQPSASVHGVAAAAVVAGTRPPAAAETLDTAPAGTTCAPGSQLQVLEIGVGPGLNLPYYPAHVGHLTTLTLEPDLPAAATRRAQERGMVLHPHTYVTTDQALHLGLLTANQAAQAAAQAVKEGSSGLVMPFHADHFDAVVCTLTLCTVPQQDVPALLREVRRVLKPGGRYHFLEHVLAEDMGCLQDRSLLWHCVRSFQSTIACGCDIGRMSLLPLEQMLKIEGVQEMPPRPGRYFIGRFVYGTAVKDSS